MTVFVSDIVAAKLMVQLGWRDAKMAQRDLINQDARSGTRDLVEWLEMTGGLAPERAVKLRRYVLLYDIVRREALYAGLIETSQLLAKDELDRWKAVLDREGYTRTLGDLLLFAKRIGAETDAALRKQQAKGLEREDARLLEIYRKNRFEGVARPITKDASARIDTGTFTIKNLFRSAESQRLARAEAATLSAMPVPNVSNTPAPMPRAERPTLDLGRASNVAAHLGEPAPSRESVVTGRRRPEMPSRIGDYTIDGILGRGGMGIVYEAHREGDPLPVALKLGLSKEDEYRARLKREILATSMLAHENVVQVLDAGEAPDGSPYLVMELVEGRELRELLKERGALPPREALAIFVQVLGAAGAAHQAGIVHRDLKPENVLVSEADGKLVAKVMDFGLARIVELDPEHREKVFQTVGTDTVSGSPQYLSPEQVLGDAVDGRTDLYALGVVLFELLTGVLPFTADSLGEIVRAHVQKPPPRLADVKPDGRFPEALESLVAWLLEKVPAKRPADAAAVVRRITDEVLPALNLAPPPPPPPPPPQTGEPPRRPRGITTVLTRLQDQGPAPRSD